MIPVIALVAIPAPTGIGAAALVAIGSGIALGTVSGLTPGLHANTFALLLAAAAPGLPGPPTLVGATMLAAGTTHTFLDVVPALALGVPDPAMAASALPGHRLVIEGRGREALRLSALGSGLAVVFAVPLALPVTAVMKRAIPHLQTHLPLVMAGIAAVLILTERDLIAQVGAALALGGSAVLGGLTLDLDPTAPLAVGGMLAPLFAGLFGAPVLLDALGGAGVPPQDDATVASSWTAVGGVALVGTVSGAVVGYVPGVSSAIAATLALGLLSGTGPRAFVVATSGVNTANTVFALFALVALGSPRTGVLVAVERAGVPLAVGLFLTAIALSAGVAFLLVPVVGDRYLQAVERVDYAKLSVGVLTGLVGLSFLFAGTVGVAVFGAAALLGLVPARFRARRANLMGVLLGPIAISA